MNSLRELVVRKKVTARAHDVREFLGSAYVPPWTPSQQSEESRAVKLHNPRCTTIFFPTIIPSAPQMLKVTIELRHRNGTTRSGNPGTERSMELA